VDDVSFIPLDLNCGVSCFPTFKPTQEEFDTYDRYEHTQEIPEYDPSDKSFSLQEAVMMDSKGHLKVSGDSNVKMSSLSYIETSEKLQDLSIAFDDNTILADLERDIKISEVSMSSVIVTMR
jgi:hypothetical protein